MIALSTSAMFLGLQEALGREKKAHDFGTKKWRFGRTKTGEG